MLTNGIILVISRCDTLRPLGILFRPFTNNVHGTKYHNHVLRNVVLEHMPHLTEVVMNNLDDKGGHCIWTINLYL